MSLIARTQRRLKFYSHAPNTTSWSNIHLVTTILCKVLMTQNATRNTCKPFLVSWLETYSDGTSFIWDWMMFFAVLLQLKSGPRGPHTRLKVVVGLWVIIVLKKCSYIRTWFIYSICCVRLKFVIRWILDLRTGSWICWNKSRKT